MSKRIAWEKNWLKAHGWSQHEIEALEKSDNEMPVEYLTGAAEFLNLKLIVNQNVLIPRLETEQLVSLVINELKEEASLTNKSATQQNESVKVIEAGTGSGAIAVAIAPELNGKLLAIDISEEALEVAKKNVGRYNLHEKIELRKNDLLADIDWQNLNLSASYYLIANLPYIPQNDLKTLQRSVRDFEPELALDGSIDGFSVIRRLLQQVSNLTHKPSKIFLEIDPSHDQKFFAEFTLYEWRWQNDFWGTKRFAIGTRK